MNKNQVLLNQAFSKRKNNSNENQITGQESPKDKNISTGNTEIFSKLSFAQKENH